MPDMIKRIGDAALNAVAQTSDMSVEEAVNYVGRAAIEAMREPTWEMCLARIPAPIRDTEDGGELALGCGETWTIMADAALGIVEND